MWTALLAVDASLGVTKHGKWQPRKAVGMAKDYVETQQALPAIDSMLEQSASLAEIVRGYLGERVR